MLKQLATIAGVLLLHGLTFSATRAVLLDDEAELSIGVDASPEAVVTGSYVTYTVTVDNEGPGIASGVVVTDVLPDETTFVSCAATGGGICGGTGNNRNVTFSAMMPDTAETITIVALVNCEQPDGAEIGNTASVRSAAPDPEADEDENETVFITASNPPPIITGESATPSALWPPSHAMADITVDYHVVDTCGPIRVALSVSSNESIDGAGDGHTAPDWEVIDAHHVRVRSERSGNLIGRVYTIAVTAIDSAGQTATQTVAVRVPRNRSRQRL
jgi:uncharacterized repeat protein (TIGR01451 family)